MADVLSRRNHRAGGIRVVGVLDVDTDTGGDDRNDGLIVENGEAGVRQFAHLAVGQRVDGARVVDNLRVDRVNGGDVGEVFVEVDVKAAGEDGAGNVTAAAGKSGVIAILVVGKEARYDDDFAFLQAVVGDGGIAAFE